MSTAFGFLKKVGAEFFEGFHLAVVKKDGADVVSLQIEGRNVVGNLIVKDSGGIEKGVVREGDSTMLLEEEALRVIKASPDWKPGKIRGKKVKSRISLNVEFRLEKKK